MRSGTARVKRLSTFAALQQFLLSFINRPYRIVHVDQSRLTYTSAMAPSFPDLTGLPRLQPWMVLLPLLGLCLAKGLWFTAGLTVPPDLDIVRDLGFIQGLHDGNLFGDPVSPAGWRWYPPLVHLAAAAVSFLIDRPLMDWWIAAGPWLNLLSPLAFYAMGTRLFGAWPACAATVVFVLHNSTAMAGDEAAGYTPWTLTPSLTWPLFFAAVAVIHGRVARLRWLDAVIVGITLGLVFLAHTVPALLLAPMLVAAVLAHHGLRARAAVWLALAALTAGVVAAPFLAPLLVVYRLHIANPVPGAWVHPLLSEEYAWRLLLLNVPGLTAAVGMSFLHGTQRPVRRTIAMMAAWIGACGMFLLRHYGCGDDRAHGVCGVFVVAVHHYHVYLQAAWACLIGFAVAACWPERRRFATGATAVAAVAGAVLLFAHPRDREMYSGTAAEPGSVLDRAAYDWILAHTAPGTMFVTELPLEIDRMGPAAATVIAAGRPLAAPPRIHGNPYLDWLPANARREAWLRAARDGDAPALCRLRNDAGGTDVLLLLPVAATVTPEPVFSTSEHAIYRADCPDQPKVANTSSMAFNWFPTAEDGTMIRSRTPASRHASARSRTFAAGPNSVLSISQRSEK